MHREVTHIIQCPPSLFFPSLSLSTVNLTGEAIKSEAHSSHLQACAINLVIPAAIKSPSHSCWHDLHPSHSPYSVNPLCVYCQPFPPNPEAHVPAQTFRLSSVSAHSVEWVSLLSLPWDSWDWITVGGLGAAQALCFRGILVFHVTAFHMILSMWCYRIRADVQSIERCPQWNRVTLQGRGAYEAHKRLMWSTAMSPMFYYHLTCF